MKLKVCGMKDPENIQEIAALHPDYIGFIFYENSPRNFAGEIPPLNRNIKKIGVFVDGSAEFILEKVKKYDFQAVQLHGNESPELCATIKAEGPEIIKVFSVGEEFDFSQLQKYEDKVDYFLFDTRGKDKGGNGIVFNWELLKNYPSQTPFFLSGGIGPEEASDIREFIQALKKENKDHLFYGLDVNSRFEQAPGLKKVEDIKEFQKELNLK